LKFTQNGEEMMKYTIEKEFFNFHLHGCNNTFRCVKKAQNKEIDFVFNTTL